MTHLIHNKYYQLDELEAATAHEYLTTTYGTYYYYGPRTAHNLVPSALYEPSLYDDETLADETWVARLTMVTVYENVNDLIQMQNMLSELDSISDEPPNEHHYHKLDTRATNWTHTGTAAL